MRAATYNDVFAFLWRSIISISRFFDCFGFPRNRPYRQLSQHNHGEIVQESNVAPCLAAEDKEEYAGEEHESLIPHVDRSDIKEQLLEEGKIAQEPSVTSLNAAEDKEECTVEEQQTLIYHVDRSHIEEQLLDEGEIAQESGVSSLVTSEDKEESTVTQYENLMHEVDQSHIDDELLEQAKFLKACGTLPETPAEIRKVVSFAEKEKKSDIKESRSLLKSSVETSDEIQQAQAVNHHENAERSDFCTLPSVLEFSPETSEEIQVRDASEDSAKSDAQRPHGELRSSPGSGTLLETPAEIRKVVSFAEKVEKLDITESQSVLMPSSETPDEIQQMQEGSDLCILPSVLESSPETSEATQVTETSSEGSAKSDARSALRSSPYPTPRRITDDMQTPGTVYATNMKNLAQGNLQIRSQYVYTVLNPIENLDHQHESKAEKSSEHESPDHEGAYLSEQESITPCSRMNSTAVADSSGKENNIGSVSLSYWLKPPLYNNDASRHNVGRTTEDKPIIGLVNTEWNEQDETSHLSPKLWDINGIPNSTSKYKEDQKVRWHATPFEERLERALSETTSASLRKPIDGMPIVFEETEDEQYDTGTVVLF